MDYTNILTTMFGDSQQMELANNVITGYANYQGQKFAIIGIVNEAMLDNPRSLALADFVLRQKTGINFLIILDTGGQQATHKAELLGLNRYCAHLIKSIHFKRHQGSRVFAVVIGKALGGAFIATALNAEKIYALPQAQISVMWLEAMAKVTKIPISKLQELSKTSPIFAPGAENFYKLGALEQILDIEEVMSQVMADLAKTSTLDDWRNNALERGGRNLAARVVSEILSA
jgi:malonate decarboxylase gamma subunit